MKTIIKGAALVALSLLWAACGHLITAFGLNLNTMFGVEWAVYVLWGCLAGLFLLLLVPLLVSLCRAVFSGAAPLPLHDGMGRDSSVAIFCLRSC